MAVAKAWLAVLACLFMAVFLWDPPGDLAEDVPQHRLVGSAFGAFGVLLGVTLAFGKSRTGLRLRGLLLAVTSAALCVLFGLAAGPPLRDAWRLSRDGAPAEATAVRIRRLLEGKGLATRTTVAYAGHTAELRLRAQPGERIPVLYLPAEPKVVAPARDGTSFLDLARTLGGGNRVFAFAGLGLLAVVGVLAGAKTFLFGPPPESATKKGARTD